MNRVSELRIMTVLRLMVQEYRPLHQKVNETERQFLLSEFKKLNEEDAWWSDEEWDWFVNRCLDFLGVPK
jgi:hypothetical protein